MKTLVTTLCVLSGLVAYAANPAAQTPPAFASCEAAAAYYKDQIGQPLDGPVTFKPHRVIKPGSVVTMDFNPQRLNVHIDAKGTIIDARCG